MGLARPGMPDRDGDDYATSPMSNKESLLATERGTDKTRRVEVDDQRNLNVHIQADSSGGGSPVSALAIGSTGPINATTLTTIINHVAAADENISKISCSGDGPADYTLIHNVTQIDIKRTTQMNLDAEFKFEDPYPIQNGDILTIKVYHHATGKTKTFDATIYGA